ncbi:MAG: hypothetical protein Q8R06_03860 [Polaromonas sp.]|uniref:hypothetical protein n=1 Tax=Polaromonas sp. TaxID=1869339 RepID=UPI002732E232|nr:hypothetical protein [Polaromonas sp.]MDP3796270.1 hypothetical protein [Polaromonas sp.]
MNHSNTTAATDKDVQSLLVRYKCPTPFHVVRSLFMGNIASTRLGASPLGALAQIWGGEMPAFGSQKDVEEVTGTLVQGLWNRLADHQNSRNPFRLTRSEVLPTRQALHDMALLRAQELEGFVDGLFGPEDEMLLPQKAHDAVQALAELYSMFGGTAELLADEEKPAPAHELKALLRNLQQLTIAADELINKAVQSSKRSRSQRLEAMNTVPSRRAMSSGRKNPGASASDVPDFEDSQEPEFIESALSQNVTRNGVSVRVEIYGDSDGRWILEVVDAEKASHVWDEPFETDQQALAEALRALDEETLEFWGATADRPMS